MATGFWRGAGKARWVKSTSLPPPSRIDFREVKARAKLDDAAEAVTERQKQRIAAAAEIWLAANPMPAIRDMRFDAILVAPGKLTRHVPAAFETN